MSRAVQSLLRLEDERPRCDVAGCRRLARRVVVTPLGRVRLCAPHVDPFIARCKAAGRTAELLEETL